MRTMIAVAALLVHGSLYAEPSIIGRSVALLATMQGIECEDLNAPNPFGRGFPSIPETGDLTPEGAAEFQRMQEGRFPRCPTTGEPAGEAR